MIPRFLLPTVALAFALGAFAAPALAGQPRQPNQVTCQTPGVTDGDTLRCASERVRLFGLDAPERYQPGGPAATRALADLTRGQAVTCHEAGRRSYGRLVARCYVNGQDLTCSMIRMGVAREWLRYSKGQYEGCRP